MGKDIGTLLWMAKFSSKKEIIKYLREKDYFDIVLVMFVVV